MSLKKPIIRESETRGWSGDAYSIDALCPMLQQLFAQSRDSVFVVDSQMVVVFANERLLDYLNVSLEALLGNPISKMLATHADLEALNQQVRACIDTKQPTSYHQTLNAETPAYQAISLTPITGKHQHVIGCIGTISQVAIEQTLAHQQVKEQEAFQRVLMDNIPFMVWLKDKRSRILSVNAAYAEAAGVESAKLLEGKTDADIWPVDLASGYIEDDAVVMETGEPVHLSEQVAQKGYAICWAETYKAPVKVGNEVIGTVGYARDLSSEKALATIAAEKELEYSALFKKLPLSIIRYDRECRRIFMNAQKGGYENEIDGLIGSTPMEVWSDAVVNVTGEEYQAKLMHVLFHGESQTFELECESGGDHVIQLINILPEFDDHYQVTGALAIASDITEVTQYRKDLEFMAYHDSLTGLPNRTLLNQRLQAVAVEGNHFGLMFMDLDFFKSINDTLGHVVGDELLLEVAKRILDAVRNDDLVARIGGDEFAIVVTNLKHDEDLALLATKIANRLAEPFNIEGINFFVTASIGVSAYPHDSDNVEDLIKYADSAMYEAKRQGRNNYQFYTPELTEKAMEHLAIATALRYAIGKNEFKLLYQPKVDIATGMILGAETLLRWHGKVLGQIQPDKFIPIAEESGLIIDIGAWVLKASCEAAVQLNQYRAKPLNVAVNVSSKEFVGTNFITHLEGCLRETGCKPEWLTLEITESLLFDDGGKALETLIKIDEMGIKLSIDDFGTGYSALAYLSKFPIRQVKIDRSFVTDICDSQSSALLIKAIIAMADSLNKELVAEGIETVEQAELIQQYGCHQAQGYLYGKPVTFNDFSHMAAQQKVH